MTGENINKMISLSLKKKSMLKEILDLTKQQSQLIKDEKLDEMGDLLEDKEKKMSQVDELDLHFLSLYNEVKEKEEIETISKMDASKYSNLKDLKSIVESINSILEEIRLLDKKNTDQMKANLKDIQNDIKNVKRGKQAYRGYNKEPAESILIDEKK